MTRDCQPTTIQDGWSAQRKKSHAMGNVRLRASQKLGKYLESVSFLRNACYAVVAGGLTSSPFIFLVLVLVST